MSEGKELSLLSTPRRPPGGAAPAAPATQPSLDPLAWRESLNIQDLKTSMLHQILCQNVSLKGKNNDKS